MTHNGTSNPPSAPRPDVLAVIIGRAGSKGLPGKNALLLAGKPMVSYSIEHALASLSVTRVIVSTDCDDIVRAARAMDIRVIRRPSDLANDIATVDAAVRHAVEQDRAPEPVIVILYANVPIRPTTLTDRAVLTLRRTGADSVQSYSEVGKHHPFWMVRIDDDSHRIEPYVENTVYRRQDLPRLVLPDGGVIAVTRESLFTEVEGQPHAFLGRDRRGIVSPSGSVVDIDTLTDFTVAEAMLREHDAQTAVR
jgi:CMP-N,N'-diacetyllegionaminic acid synthase